MAGHFFRLWDAHKLKEGRSDVTEASVLGKLVGWIRIYKDEWNRIRGVSRPWVSCLIIYHLLSISVVSADKHSAIHFLDRLVSLAYAGINGLAGLDGSFHNSRVAYHIRVREVADNAVVFATLNSLYKAVANLRSAHLRLHIVGRNLR